MARLGSRGGEVDFTFLEVLMMSGQLIGDLLSVGGKVQEERDRLAAELQESERLRTEAFHACEAMRLERDRLKTVLQEKELQRKRAAELCESMRKQRDDLQAQLEAAAVTPAQQPDSNAAVRLETLRELIDAVLGWYACTEYLAEVDHAAAWEQVGALIGHLKREAG